MSHQVGLWNLCTMSTRCSKSHIFITVRPPISFAIYNCKLENATVSLSDGHRFKMKKIVTIFTLGRKQNIFKSLAKYIDRYNRI